MICVRFDRLSRRCSFRLQFVGIERNLNANLWTTRRYNGKLDSSPNSFYSRQSNKQTSMYSRFASTSTLALRGDTAASWKSTQHIDSISLACDALKNPHSLQRKLNEQWTLSYNLKMRVCLFINTYSERSRDAFRQTMCTIDEQVARTLHNHLSVVRQRFVHEQRARLCFNLVCLELIGKLPDSTGKSGENNYECELCALCYAKCTGV